MLPLNLTIALQSGTNKMNWALECCRRLFGCTMPMFYFFFSSTRSSLRRQRNRSKSPRKIILTLLTVISFISLFFLFSRAMRCIASQKTDPMAHERRRNESFRQRRHPMKFINFYALLFHGALSLVWCAFQVSFIGIHAFLEQDKKGLEAQTESRLF